MPILSLVVETILNMLTGDPFALLIIPIFIILFDFLIRMFAKNNVLVNGFNNFISLFMAGKSSLMFKVICIMPKVVSVISLIVLSAFFNYMFFPLELATLFFVANIIVNIFTIRSCVKVYRFEWAEYTNIKQSITNKNKMIPVQENSSLKRDLSSENESEIKRQEKVTFAQGWKSFWKNYFNFKGEIGLNFFLWGILIYIIFSGILKVIQLNMIHSLHFNIIMTITIICLIIIEIPLISLNVRRLRDIGLKNGINYMMNIFLVLFGNIPLIGVLYKIFILILLCMPTGKFSNSSKEM